MAEIEKPTTTVSIKRQVTLRRASPFPQTDIDKVFGMLKSPVGPLSLEEMDAGVAEEARRRAFD